MMMINEKVEYDNLKVEIEELKEENKRLKEFSSQKTYDDLNSRYNALIKVNEDIDDKLQKVEKELKESQEVYHSLCTNRLNFHKFNLKTQHRRRR